MSNETAKPQTPDTDKLWKEMREESGKTEDAPKDKPQFQILPDGNYNARVEIQSDSVNTAGSPNYGRPKYTIKLTVIEGELKGKMAYINRVLLPYNLANQPSEQDTDALQKWSAEVKTYLKKTDEILEKCGVMYLGTDKNRYVLEIAANNKRNPIVNFTIKGGNAYINNVVNKEPANKDELFSGLPDGNDAPIQ